jgi:hypothetical protein
MNDIKIISDKIEDYKKVIGDLFKIQDELLSELEIVLQLDDNSMMYHVFDYIYHSDKPSFEEYLNDLDENVYNKFKMKMKQLLFQSSTSGRDPS